MGNWQLAKTNTCENLPVLGIFLIMSPTQLAKGNWQKQTHVKDYLFWEFF